MIDGHEEVSVPFRGISFLNGSTRNASWLILFPSPSGVSHFSIYTIQLTKKDYHFVSVPFRGISFLNIVNATPHSVTLVSVPFRGISFLNGHHHNYDSIRFWFPSPSGVSHFSIQRSLYATFLCLSFRPLPGYLISQY